MFLLYFDCFVCVKFYYTGLEEDINAFGRYDKLVEQVNIDVAKEYFEKAEKTEIPKRKVRSKLDKLLREFILSGGFEISTNE